MLKFEKNELDPDKFVQNKKVSDNFAINFFFGKFCDCNEFTEITDRCTECTEILEQTEEGIKWMQIGLILRAYSEI